MLSDLTRFKLAANGKKSNCLYKKQCSKTQLKAVFLSCLVFDTGVDGLFHLLRRFVQN